MQEGKGIFLGIVVIILALALAAVILWKPTSIQQTAQQSQIQVTGNGKLMLAPDQAEFNVGVDTTGKTAADAQQQNSQMTAAVIAALQSAGIPTASIQTSGYIVTPEYSYPQTGGPILLDYKTSNTLTIKTNNLDSIGSYIDTAVNAGANRVEQVQFELSDGAQAQAKVQVLSLATADAKQKAAAIAQASGVTLGKIISISENQFNVIPFFKAANSIAGPAPATPIQPSNVEVDGQIQMSYSI